MDEREKRNEAPLLSSETPLKKAHKERKPGSKLGLRVLILVLIAGLAAGAYFIAGTVKPAEEVQETSSSTREAVRYASLEKPDVLSIHLENETGTYTLLRDEAGRYAVQDKPAFVLNQTLVDNLFASFVYLYVTPVADAADDMQAYGLDTPVAKATVTSKTEPPQTFLLGAKAPSGSRYYMMVDGQPEIYAVPASTANAFFAELSFLHALPTFDIASAEAVENVTLVHPDGATVEVGLHQGDTIGVSSVWLKQPFAYEANNEKVAALFQQIAALTIERYVADVPEASRSEYGLAEGEYSTLTVRGLPPDATLVSLRIGRAAPNGGFYVQIDDSQKVYTMGAATLAFLGDLTPAKLIDRFANIINIQKVDALQISGMGLEAEITITRTPQLDKDGRAVLDGSGNPQVAESFALNGAPVAERPFRKLYQIIIGTQVDGIIPDGKVPDASVAASLTVRYRLNETRDEEVVEYIPYDQDHYAVRRNGVCMFYILKARVDQIPAAIQDTLDGIFDAANYGL